MYADSKPVSNSNEERPVTEVGFPTVPHESTGLLLSRKLIRILFEPLPLPFVGVSYEFQLMMENALGKLRVFQNKLQAFLLSII